MSGHAHLVSELVAGRHSADSRLLARPVVDVVIVVVGHHQWRLAVVVVKQVALAAAAA